MVQTQVIPYLRELVKGGHELVLLTFEPGKVDEAAVRESLAADGIEWYWLRYHKRPSVPATLFDIVNGARFIRKLNAERKFDILHARSHVPMMMAALARKGVSHKPKLLFDIRGFMPEEYVDAGVWDENGLVYRNFKRVETWLMKEADGFVVLTAKAREILRDEIGSRPAEVIPCCVDLRQRFAGDREELRIAYRAQLGVSERFVVLHLGALGGLYLVNEIAEMFSTFREIESSVFPLFLTQSDPNLIEPLLMQRGFRTGDYHISRVAPSEIEGWLYASDVGLSVVKATYSTASRSPTKIPEYLAAGLPVIANSGVGDVDALIERYQVGAVFPEFSGEDYRNAFVETRDLGEIADLCRRTAQSEFDLKTIGGVRYRRLYEKVTNL